MNTYWLAGPLTGRTSGGFHKPNMQNIPRPPEPLEVRILWALRDDNVKTFGQLEMLCMNPKDVVDVASTSAFATKLDETLRIMIDDGRVLLVARRPELCFRKGSVLDRILKEVDRPDD